MTQIRLKQAGQEGERRTRVDKVKIISDSCSVVIFFGKLRKVYKQNQGERRTRVDKVGINPAKNRLVLQCGQIKKSYQTNKITVT